MVELVRMIWEPVNLVEASFRTPALVKVVDETVAVPELTLAIGIEKIAVVYETVGVTELMNALGAQITKVATEALVITEASNYIGPLHRVSGGPDGASDIEVAETVVVVLVQEVVRTIDTLDIGIIIPLVADLPALTQRELDTPSLYAFASLATETGTWSPPVTVFESAGGKTNYYGAISKGATMGSVIAKNFVPPAIPEQWDNASTIDVTVTAGDILETVTDEDVLGGENHIVIGGGPTGIQPPEIIAFRDVEDLGEVDLQQQYRLSRLIRRRYMTEADDGSIGLNSNQTWALLNDAATPLEWSWSDIDIERTLAFIPHGAIYDPDNFSDDYGTVLPRCFNQRPFPVTSLTAAVQSDLSWAIAWVRTSRAPRQRVFAERGTIDADPIKFNVDILTSPTDDTVKSTIVADGVEAVSYTSAQQVIDFGSNQSAITINVYRVNDWGSGIANQNTFPLPM